MSDRDDDFTLAIGKFVDALVAKFGDGAIDVASRQVVLAREGADPHQEDPAVRAWSEILARLKSADPATG